MKKQHSKVFYIVPVLAVILVISAVLLLFFPGSGSASASGILSLNTDEYVKALGVEQFSDLFQDVGDNYNTAYVLQYAGESNLDFKTISTYAVYVPGAGSASAVGLGTSGPVFSRHLKLDLDSTGQTGNDVYCITSHSDKEMDFRVYLDGKRIDTKIVDVDFNPIPSIE